MAVKGLGNFCGLTDQPTNQQSEQYSCWLQPKTFSCSKQPLKSGYLLTVSVLLLSLSKPRCLYRRINMSVPLLDRCFNQQEHTWPDFSATLAAWLDHLNQERRHRWGATIDTLVFLFWLATGASYRVVSRVFGVPPPHRPQCH